MDALGGGAGAPETGGRCRWLTQLAQHEAQLGTGAPVSHCSQNVPTYLPTRAHTGRARYPDSNQEEAVRSSPLPRVALLLSPWPAHLALPVPFRAELSEELRLELEHIGWRRRLPDLLRREHSVGLQRGAARQPARARP